MSWQRRYKPTICSLPTPRVTARGHKAWEYRYRIIDGADLSNQNVPTFSAGSQLHVVVVSRCSDLPVLTRLCCSYSINSGEHSVNTSDFQITSVELLDGRWSPFTSSSIGDFRKDLLCFLVTHHRCSLDVNIPVPAAKSLETILKEDIRLIHLPQLGSGYFYQFTGPLQGLLLEHLPLTDTSHTLSLLTRTDEHVLLLIGGLYELLPFGTTIFPTTL